jgi:hypothetical protein
MKTLVLVSPQDEDPPLGLAYIASYLRKNDIDWSIKNNRKQ